MIDFSGIYKSYADQDLLINASLRINPGDKIGLIGPNGAGKSTLFGMITGDTPPDKGKVQVPQNARLGYLKQQLPDNATERTVIDFVADAIPELNDLLLEIKSLEHEISGSKANTDMKLRRLGELQHKYEALGGYTIKTRAAVILSGLGFEERRFTDLLSEFSGGWQMRAGLARVLAASPDIMLLDEPSNYLDIPAIEWLQRYLRSFKGTLLLISHDRYLLKSLTNITVEISNGILTRYAGNYDYYEREKEQRIISQKAAKQNQDKKKEQIERFVERFRAKNTKASQVKSRLKTLEKMEDIRIAVHRNNAPIRLPEPPHSGSEIIRLNDACFSYGENAFNLVNINLTIEKGAKIAFAGYNGTGKTTLLKVLAGVLPLEKGSRVLGHKVIIGYQAQEFSDILPPEQTLSDIMRHAMPVGEDMKRIRSVLGSFGFTGDDVDKQCQVLSGGEKIRLSFARIFINHPNFLILDEPTTHLDLHTRESLQKAISDYKGTVCLVSHDIEFVKKAADTIVEMRPPSIKKYYGNCRI
jgi:ATP-binding cassette subfamily F protein 3